MSTSFFNKIPEFIAGVRDHMKKKNLVSRGAEVFQWTVEKLKLFLKAQEKGVQELIG